MLFAVVGSVKTKRNGSVVEEQRDQKMNTRTMLFGSVLSIAALCFGVQQSAHAVVLDAGYNLFSGNAVGKPNYTPGVDLGFFIWTEDASKRSWHVRWSGDSFGLPSPQAYKFEGTINLSGDTNTLEVNPYSFESGESFRHSPDYSGVRFKGWAGANEDGLEIQILGNEMLYIGFDLMMDFGMGSADDIFIGAEKSNPSSDRFKIGAPAIALSVSEPGTLLLIGAGLIAVAIYGRRVIR